MTTDLAITKIGKIHRADGWAGFEWRGWVLEGWTFEGGHFPADLDARKLKKLAWLQGDLDSLLSVR